MRMATGAMAAAILAALVFAGPGLVSAEIEKAEVAILGGMQCSL